MELCFENMAMDAVSLLQSEFKRRAELNRAYLMSLREENILQNHYLEAGLGTLAQLRNTLHGDPTDGGDRHWGWESPTCPVRGQFLGHWLAAAARLYAATGGMEVKLKADRIVAELAKCQEKNGGEWVFSIPEKYLHWLGEGKPVWAPQYVIHKTLMGLFEMHALTGSEQALCVLEKAALWLHRWSGQFSREKMDDILDVETGGMLELWANLYGATGKPVYAELMERYTRSRLFDPLLKGRDVLTNMHANTTIPEAHGAAPRIRGHRRRDVAPDRGSLLAVRRRRPGNVLHGRANLGRDLDSAFRICRAPGR